jgi:hypothetical protein
MIRLSFPVVVLIGILACLTAAQMGGGYALAQANRTTQTRDDSEDLDDGVIPPPNEDCEELAVDEALKKEKSKISAILREGRFNGNQPFFDQYYTDYAFPRWSHWKNIPLFFTSKSDNFRKDLKNDLQTKTQANQVHDHLNALTLDYMMNKLVLGNVYRATKINAMLMIGELNSVEPTGSKMPVPWPEALKTLVAAAGNAKLSDDLHVAAMVGILRHTALGIQDEDNRKSVTTTMYQILASEAPAGAAVGHDWLCGQALEVLAMFHSPGEGNATFKAMLGAVADAKLSFRTRSIAAASLGRLNYAGATGIDPVEAAVVLEQFAAGACTEELRLLKIATAAAPATAAAGGVPVAPIGPGAGGFGGAPGMGVAPVAPGAAAAAASLPAIEPRRLKPLLDDMLTALGGVQAEENCKGILSLAKDDQPAVLVELQKAVKALSDLLGDSRSDAKKMEDAVKQLPKTLDAWKQKISK